MDQDRRDAAAWAKEWQIRRKNRAIIIVIAAIALAAAIGYMINFIIVHAERTTFGSEEEMRAAMQGRYARESDYEDIMIEGDDIIMTYLSYSHYDREYAETYGYNFDVSDSSYDDRIVEWDYRNGVIKTHWMGDIIVDKDGNIRRGDSFYGTFYRTDKPRPEPIDPSTLEHPEGSLNAELSTEEEQAIEEREESQQMDEEAVEESAPETVEGDGDVQA